MKNTVKANAKINISLKVLSKEQNGYHKLDMFNALIDLSDKLIFKESNTLEVKMTKKYCRQEDNLCYKVAKYIKEKYKVNKGVKIIIKKRIPAKYGLGGGSSDAAQTIIFLNKYWNLNMTSSEMMSVGYKFGSDIPFFIEGSNARVQGFGENIIPIKESIKKEIIIIIPDFGCSTKDVFDKFNKFSNNEIEEVIQNVINHNKYENLFNDLMCSADMNCAGKIKDIFDECNKIGIKTCCMTGSGSAVVCYCENINEYYKTLKKTFKNYKIIKTKILDTCC